MALPSPLRQKRVLICVFIESKQRGHSLFSPIAILSVCTMVPPGTEQRETLRQTLWVLLAAALCFCLTQVRQLQGAGTSHRTELCSGFKMQMNQCSTSGGEVRGGPAVVGNTSILESSTSREPELERNPGVDGTLSKI